MSLHHGYRDAFAITPSDTVNFARPCEGIWVGGLGTVAVVMASGAVVSFNVVVDGTLLPVKATRVNAAGTSATLLVGLWGA